VTVALRPLSESDVDDIMTWVNDPDVVGNLAAFAGEPFTRDDELAWIRRTLASTSDVVYSILDATSGRYLGQIGIHQIHARSKVGRLGVVVAARADMGKGHGTAAIRAIADLGFGALGLHKLWVMLFAHNARSRGIYARIGFAEEGVLREEYFHAGAWHDMVRMAALAREWPTPGVVAATAGTTR
jgi:RimJ/RimL family protein N-acetyltransferase